MGDFEVSRWQVSRRDFLKASGVSLAALAGNGIFAGNALSDIGRDGSSIIRFGMVTDVHYADVVGGPTRYYSESLGKLTECINLMNAEQVDFLIELGDFKDTDWGKPVSYTIQYLQTIEALYQQFNGPAYHVLGNHDIDRISKAQFLANTANPAWIDPNVTTYSFDSNGIHFVVLDPNNSALEITAEQMQWLEQDLAATNKPVIVFSHQILEPSCGGTSLYINNHAEVRDILEDSGKVLAAFSGHHHCGTYNEIGDIYYYTLKGMIEGTGEENSAYAIVDIDENFNITITGYRTAISMDLAKFDKDMPVIWVDGQSGGNGTNSTVFIDDYTTHDSLVSVGFGYENIDSPYVSEAYREFAAGRDWSGEDCEVLSMWCMGGRRNTAAQIYVRLEDADGGSSTSIVTDTSITTSSVWNQLVFDLENFVGVDLSRVKKVTIGIGEQNATEAGGHGVVYFDEIVVGGGTCVEPLDGDINGDCRVNYNDMAIMADEWLSEGNELESDINNQGSSAGKVDFKDFASMAKEWLKSNLLPGD